MPRGVLCDVHGVLYVYPDAIPRSAEAVAAIQASGKPFCFLTNSTQFPKRRILADLAEVGIHLAPEHLLTSPSAAAALLRREGLDRLGWLCTDDLREDFPDFTFLDPRSETGAVDAVVIGDIGDGFTYPVMSQAFRWIHEGARLVALARNRFYQSREGLVLDCGPYVKLLEEATGSQATVTGKPSPGFFEAGLKQIGVSGDEAVMVGDDLDFDVLPAMNLGMTGVLVQTGKFRDERYRAAPKKPDHLVRDLHHAVESGLLG